MSAIQEALEQQGVLAAWRGSMPTDPAELTDEYLDADMGGFPRMNATGKSSADVNIPQLKSAFAVAKSAEDAAEANRAQREIEINEIIDDQDLRDLAAMTSEQVDDYVDAELTGVPLKSQVHFKKLTKMIAVLARGVFN